MKYTVAHTKLQLAYQRAHKSGVKIKEDTGEQLKDEKGVEQFMCKPIQELATQNHELARLKNVTQNEYPFQLSIITSTVFILGFLLGGILSSLVFYFVLNL
jgi:hypothetical protein